MEEIRGVELDAERGNAVISEEPVRTVASGPPVELIASTAGELVAARGLLQRVLDWHDREAWGLPLELASEIRALLAESA